LGEGHCVSLNPSIKGSYKLSILVQIAAAYTVLMSIGAFSILDRMLYGQWYGKGGDKLTVLLNLVAIANSFFLAFMGSRARGALCYKPPYLVISALAFLVLSVMWSFSPIASLKLCFNYIVLVIGAWGMAFALRPIQIMRVTVRVCTASAIASICVLPTSLGRMSDPETGAFDFIGIFGYKNLLGEAMVAGVLAALYCMMGDKHARLRYAFLIALYVLLILACKSGTSLIISGCYILLLIIMLLYAKGGIARVASVAALTVALLVSAIISIDPNWALESLGKDPTLTGRTELWPYVIDAILEKPLFGWGFDGFWFPSNPAATSISDAVGWSVPEAHNGLLELLLQLGIFGTALFMANMVGNVSLAVKCIKRGDKALGRIMLLFIVGVILMSVSEAILLTPSMIPTLQFFLYRFMCDADLAVVAARRRVPTPTTPQPAAAGKIVPIPQVGETS
jgi:exopolysaccharide production protein ExoQ